MRAAICVRVSTKKEEQESSLVNQRQYFEDYVKNKGWDIYDFYIEVESGTKKNRKTMERLIADAKQKKFDIILSKELSRLARNQSLALDIKEVIENYRIHLITMDGAIDTTTGNTSMFGLFAWIYEQEAQRTSERIKAALGTMAKKGMFKGSNAPYGYKVMDGKLLVSDDGTPEFVKMIFNMYLEGNGFDAIARKLYNEGVKTPSQVAGKKNQTSLWHGSSVRKILENPHYAGNLVQNRSSTISVTNKKRNLNTEDRYIVVENTHEAIISKEMFESVQALIESRRKKSVDNPEVSSRPHENVHLFTGVIFCEDCGTGFHYKKNRRGYICGRYNKHGRKACSDHHVLEESLISIIQSDLNKLAKVFKDDVQYAFIKGKMTKEKARLEKELKSCNSKIEQINQLKSKALTRFLNNDIPKEEYDNFVALKNGEMKELMSSKMKIETALSSSLDTNALENIKDAVDNALAFNELTRKVINRFIEKIEVKADGTIKLYYRFVGSAKILNELMD
jgi:site-specific DNA recombinase